MIFQEKKAEKGKTRNWKESLSEKNRPFLGAPSPLMYTWLFRGRSVARAEAKKKNLGILESLESRRSLKNVKTSEKICSAKSEMNRKMHFWVMKALEKHQSPRKNVNLLAPVSG